MVIVGEAEVQPVVGVLVEESRQMTMVEDAAKLAAVLVAC